MFKCFLTSFHVKVKKLIVAFEPYFEKDEKKDGCQKTLVLRVPEIECGTFVSEDTNLSSDHGAEDFLGISHVTNFVKFQGAVLELLQTDGVDNQSCRPCASDSCFSDQFLGRCRSNPTTPILTGKRGGFSGNSKLSIPWKNVSLNICKLDAEVCLDPVELRLQPSTIKWFLLSWETCKHIDKDGRGVHIDQQNLSTSIPLLISIHHYPFLLLLVLISRSLSVVVLHLPSHLLLGKNQSVKQCCLDHILYLTGYQIILKTRKMVSKKT